MHKREKATSIMQQILCVQNRLFRAWHDATAPRGKSLASLGFGAKTPAQTGVMRMFATLDIAVNPCSDISCLQY